MSLDLLPDDIRSTYESHEWRHACAILKHDFPSEWDDVINVLRGFRLIESDIRAPGGGKSSATVDTRVVETRTHKVDLYKNRVGLEVEWNNKHPFSIVISTISGTSSNWMP